MRSVLLKLIRFYRRGVSPMRLVCCRFEPSCSAYAEEAVDRYGAAKGGAMMIRRLLRCRPFGASGYDPVPAQPRSPGMNRAAAPRAESRPAGTDRGSKTAGLHRWASTKGREAERVGRVVGRGGARP